MGGKPPSQSSEQKRAQSLQISLLEKQLEQSKDPLDLPRLKIPKPPAPPVVQNSKDVELAAAEARQRALRRTNTGRGTLFAGETGGYGRKSTLLG